MLVRGVPPVPKGLNNIIIYQFDQTFNSPVVADSCTFCVFLCLFFLLQLRIFWQSLTYSVKTWAWNLFSFLYESWLWRIIKWKAHRSENTDTRGLLGVKLRLWFARDFILTVFHGRELCMSRDVMEWRIWVLDVFCLFCKDRTQLVKIEFWVWFLCWNFGHVKVYRVMFHVICEALCGVEIFVVENWTYNPFRGTFFICMKHKNYQLRSLIKISRSKIQNSKLRIQYGGKFWLNLTFFVQIIRKWI